MKNKLRKIHNTYIKEGTFKTYNHSNNKGTYYFLNLMAVKILGKLSCVSIKAIKTIRQIISVSPIAIRPIKP